MCILSRLTFKFEGVITNLIVMMLKTRDQLSLNEQMCSRPILCYFDGHVAWHDLP